MMTGVYRIAGRIIEITSLLPDVHEYCREYRADGVPDIKVSTTQADIDYERGRSRTADGKTSDGYLEELAVYRRIAESMLCYDTFLFHGSCVSVDGQGYLFTAKSGTGKSTHTRLWREYLGERAVMVNDDKPLIRADKDGLTVFGTPYNGKHRLGADISVPLRAVCVIERAETNRIERIDRAQAYPVILQQIYRPDDPLLMQKTLSLADRLAEMPFYRLFCNMDIDAARISYEGMIQSSPRTIDDLRP
ncbi:MAG: hypothetical protein ILP19_03990 [Oscillospiraceae bacterium]|nr:hypothetical protein [Oscillospiraceae bacterium]